MKILKFLIGFILFIILFSTFLPIFILLLLLLLVLVKLNVIKFNKTTYYDNYRFNYENAQNNYNTSFYEYQRACQELGVDINDSFEIKKKKRNEKLKKYHPDFFQSEIEKENATKITNKINEAWKIIEKYNQK